MLHARFLLPITVRGFAGLLRSAAVAGLLLALPGSGAAQEGSAAGAAPVDMNDPKAVDERADLYMVRKFYPEAVELLQRLTRLEPSEPVHFNKLGIVYHQMQQFGPAKRAYRKALELRPDYPQALNNLAAVEYSEKHYRSAILTYLKALQLSPGDATIYSNLGTAYFAYGQYEYAMDSYRFALLVDPEIFERTGGRTGNIVAQRDIQDIAAFNFYMAKTYAGFRDVEQTLLYLTKASEAGYSSLLKDLQDEAFSFLAEEPRYVEFLAQLDPSHQAAAAAGSALP